VKVLQGLSNVMQQWQAASGHTQLFEGHQSNCTMFWIDISSLICLSETG